MRRKKYKRGEVSKEGYKDNSPYKDSSSNHISSNSITMSGVGKNLIGAGLDENGKLKQIRFMKPEEEYDFKKAYSVLEMPQYQTGGQTEINPMTGQPFDMEEVVVTGQKPFNYLQGDMNLDGTVDQNDNSTQSLNAQNQQLNQEQQQDITAPPKTQFFNPYNGVDIPTAATTLGSSIESGNTLGIVGSGLKIATGIGRNIVGGIGQQRANQFALDEYNEKKRDSLTQATYQEGGLKEADVKSINSSIEGIDLEADTINSLFERVSAVRKPDTYTPNLGRYQDVGYFDVDKVENDTIKLKTTAENPYNPQTYKELIPYLQEQNPGKKVDITYVPKNLQEGGELKEEEILSGQYSGEDALQQNAEIEKGEQRQSTDGRVTEVKGDTHEQGGVGVHLEEGERILSDHTKLGGDTAKMFKKDFELDVKAKDTYAKVIDKFVTKSGLKKLYKEQEELAKKVEKETEKEDSSTKDINMQFLSKKINELEEKKKPLEQTKSMLFDKVYEIQESKKPKSEQKQDSFQIGGQMYNSDQIKEYAKKYDIEPKRAMELIEQYQAGGEFGNKGMAAGLPEGQSLDSSTNLYGGITQQQLSDTILRNPWFDWTNFDPANPSDIQRFQQEFNQRSTEGANIEEDGKFGIQTQSVQLPFSSEGQVVLSDQQKLSADLPQGVDVPEVDKFKYRDEREKAEALQAVLLPDQSPVPPTTLQPVLKNQRRYGRLDATLIDPTEQLSELDRQQLSAQDTLSQRPDASAQATLAQITANTQNASNKVISQTNRANQQAQQRADAFNVRQGDREEDAAAQDALSYEQRMLTGLSKTNNEFQDYFEALQDNQMTNFKTIETLNYMNAANDKFQFNGQGFEQIAKSMTPEEMERAVKFAQATQKLKWGGKKRY